MNTLKVFVDVLFITFYQYSDIRSTEKNAFFAIFDFSVESMINTNK